LKDLEEEEKLSAHVACSMKKGISQNDLVGPSNFEGDGFNLKMLKKTPIFGTSSFVIHITCHGKVANSLNFVA
jgi:hypothetical protein